MAENNTNNNLTKAELQEKKEELEAQLESNKSTLQHIELVRSYINICIDKLRDRANNHDKSKLESPEAEWFGKYTSKLVELTYGSEEYKKSLEELKPALDHHYNKNDHHVEFYPNGIDDVDLIVLIEMVVDWVASTERQYNGNILKSVDDNIVRYKIDEQLAKIIKNTINKLFSK